MRRLLAVVLLALSAVSAHASMIFYAVAVPQGQAQQLVADQRRLVGMLEHKRDDVLDLEKSWHGLHYLLTGSADQPKGVLGQAIFGGREVGEDIGYGPARILSRDEVKGIAAALAVVTPATLAARYDAVTMDRLNIYPTVWTRDGPEGLRWLQNDLPGLQSFYRKAADSGSEVILLIM